MKMRFSIATKLFIGFLGALLIAAAVAVNAIVVSQASLIDSIGRSSVILTQDMLRRINSDIEHEYNVLQLFSQDREVQLEILASNNDFEKLGDIDGYIRQRDQEWISASGGEETALMAELIESEVSEKLRRFVKFYEEKSGLLFYSEIIVTNKYGANVAQTQRTTDYFQADELWWQEAKKKGYFRGDVEFDESVGRYLNSVGLGIEDDEGEFVGAIKAVVSIREIIKTAELAAKRYETTEVKVLTRDGKLLYSSEAFKFLEDLSGTEVYKKLSWEESFFIASEGQKEKLFSYAISGKDEEIKGWELLLVMSHDVNEVLKQVVVLRNSLLFVSIVLLSFGGLMAFVFSKVISKPVIMLKNAADKIGEGSLDIEVRIDSKDEFADLAKAFNNMTGRIKESRAEIDRKVKEQTKQLAEQNENLQKTKIAMISLLEDARELEEALKEEKESVEKKVEERTRDLQEEQARLMASMNNLPLGFFIVGVDHKIYLLNPAMESILGVSKDKWTFKELDSLMKKNNMDIKQLCAHCRGDVSSYGISELTFSDKYLRVITVAITLEGGKELIGTGIVVEDVTDAKLLEREKDEFFAVASHELRTPLTAIRGNASLLQQYFSEKLKDKDVKEMVEDMHSSSIRLIGIVNDFLDVSRLEQGRITFYKEPIDIADIIAETVHEVKATAEEKGLSVKFDKAEKGLPKVFADKGRTEQVLINLIGNAMKFTKKGGVEIEVGEEGKFVKVKIRDTGAGISGLNQKLLFRKFQRAGEGSLARDVTKGTGLGLYISKLMVEGMGGKIYLEKSEVGRGSTFVFTLPSA